MKKIIVENTLHRPALWTAVAAAALLAWPVAGKDPTRLRFRSGWVLNAELAPDNPSQPLAIGNVSPYEPPSLVKLDVGYAAVCVRLDPGRTLGLYDFVLEDRNGKQYACVAMRVENKQFDAGVWQLEKTNPEGRYTLLFKVPAQIVGPPPEYHLRFALFPEEAESPVLKFRRVVAPNLFTAPNEVPEDGTIGIDPVAARAEAAALATAAATAAAAGGPPASPTGPVTPANPANPAAPATTPPTVAAPTPVPTPAPPVANPSGAPTPRYKMTQAEIDALNKVLTNARDNIPKDQPAAEPKKDEPKKDDPKKPAPKPAPGGGIPSEWK
jgi:hypothetical protein